ncbi:MAG: hypothetical protein LBP83_07735 [Dysgonamonadaceae bacterium]|jgi:hypothetical protein|nr:hypothetical protein [Dysgonamonadaceae bacterium]
MKKVTLSLVVLFLGALSANAQSLANPNGSDGKQTFIWDSAKGAFSTGPSNAIEIDQVFTFAVDVAGTTLADWLAATPPAGCTRSVGFVFNTNFAENITNFDGRMAHIQGTVYGMDVALSSYANGRSEATGGQYFPADAFASGGITSYTVSIFGYSEDEWWQNDLHGLVTFESAPYTGTKAAAEFYYSDYEAPTPTWPDEAYIAAPGTASLDPDVNPTLTSIRQIVSDSPVVAYEYYSITGMKLREMPVEGAYIQKAIKADGTSIVTKAFNIRK